MCILIVLRGYHDDHPIVVAGNRDERTDRKASPPGLWLGQRRRVLSPRDRAAGGTWLAVDERGWFAGITNIAGVPPVPDAPSRGHLPHLVLDQEDFDDGIAAVLARVKEHAHAGFQLVLCNGRRTVVLHHARGQLRVIEWSDPLLVVTNEHGPGLLQVHGIAPGLGPMREVEQRLDALVPVLKDRGGEGRHAICKRGDEYGTVSSSLIAIPAHDQTRLLWRYAAGPPDITEYRNYGNLGRRLLPEETQ
jgi:uncharacterized protein with NRDE domain